MRMPFDTLVTDREPFVFIEKAKISVVAGSVAHRVGGGKKTQVNYFEIFAK